MMSTPKLPHSTSADRSTKVMGLVDKGSEWILSVARHRDPLADPVGILRNAETC